MSASSPATSPNRAFETRISPSLELDSAILGADGLESPVRGRCLTLLPVSLTWRDCSTGLQCRSDKAPPLALDSPASPAKLLSHARRQRLQGPRTGLSPVCMAGHGCRPGGGASEQCLGVALLPAPGRASSRVRYPFGPQPHPAVAGAADARSDF